MKDKITDSQYGKMTNRFILYSIMAHIAILAPLRFLYMMEYGVSFTQIMFFASVYNITKIAIAIPVGVISDSIGQKAFMVLGIVFKILFYYFMVISRGSIALLLLGYVLISIGDASIEYSTRSYLSFLTKRNNNFRLIQGRIEAVKTVMTVILNVLAGYIYAFNPDLVFYVFIAVMVMPLIMAITMRNINTEEVKVQGGYLSVLKQGGREAAKNKKLQKVFVTGVVLLTFYAMINNLKQPYFTSIGMGSIGIGVIGSLLELSTVIAGLNIERILNKVGQGMLQVGLGVFTLGFLLISIGTGKVGVVIYFLIPVVLLLTSISISNEISIFASDRIKTTMFSFFGLVSSVFISIALIFTGYVVDSVGVHSAGLLFAGLSGVVIVLSMVFREIGKKERYINGH